MDDQADLTYKNCEPFLPLKDGDRAKVLKVYDGDSLTLGWGDSSENHVRLACRLLGVDTPELRGSSAHEKALALRAKDRLESKVLGKIVTIRSPGKEKYGRILANLEVDGDIDVSGYMLEDAEICHPYDGGKKVGWMSA